MAAQIFVGKLKLVGGHFAQASCEEVRAKFGSRDATVDKKLLPQGAMHMDNIAFTVMADRLGVPQAKHVSLLQGEFMGVLNFVGNHMAKIECKETMQKFGRDVTLDKTIAPTKALHGDPVAFMVMTDRFGLPQALEPRLSMPDRKKPDVKLEVKTVKPGVVPKMSKPTRPPPAALAKKSDAVPMMPKPTRPPPPALAKASDAQPGWSDKKKCQGCGWWSTDISEKGECQWCRDGIKSSAKEATATTGWGSTAKVASGQVAPTGKGFDVKPLEILASLAALVAFAASSRSRGRRLLAALALLALGLRRLASIGGKVLSDARDV